MSNLGKDTESLANSLASGAEIKNAAINLRNEGLSPIWLRDKRPLERNWQNLPVKSPKELERAYAPGNNLGIRCGKWSKPKPNHGLLIVDIDIYHEDYAQDAYNKLAELADGECGPYVISGSRKGGRHYWYTCPLDQLPDCSRRVVAQADTHVAIDKDGKVKSKPAWVIEVLSTGAQVVVPPSVHPDSGETYEWGDKWKDRNEIPNIPERLLGAITGGGNTPPRTRPGGAQKHHPLTQCEFIQHCYSHAASLSEPLWYAAACNLAITEGGHDLFHELSKRDSGRYNPTGTDHKLDHAEREEKPHTCQLISSLGYTCSKMRSNGSCSIHKGRAPVVFAKQSGKTGKPAISTQVVALVDGCRLAHDADGKAFIQIQENGHYESWPIRSTNFRMWLTRQYFEQYGKVPNDAAFKDALTLLGARAQFEGDEVQAYRRVAPYGDDILLDLCNAEWECVRINNAGWEIIPVPHDVTLVRTRGMTPLPSPIRGSTTDKLWELVNVLDKDRPLLLGWLLSCLRPCGPYPILALQGEQGSAKSTSARLSRSLVDPHTTPLRSPPKTEHDLIIAASNSRVVCLDNLSGLKPELSDALCRLATGGGFSTRELYSDAEEVLFEVQRPIILNGIDDIATRQDLLDRSLLITTPTIPADKRRTERAVEQAFDAAQAQILGALLDAVSCALKNIAMTTLEHLPRMADFALWVTAAEPALGLADGEFMEAYSANQGEAVQLSLDQDSVAEAIGALTAAGGPVRGNYKAILEKLIEHARSGMSDLLPYDFPKTAKGLANRLRRLAPSLRAQGIEITFNSRSHGRNNVEIRNVGFEALEKQLEEQYAT